MDLIIKDENGKVFTALDNKTSKSAKDGSLVIAVSGTAYTGSFDVTGIDGATTTTSPLPTSVAVGSTGTTLAGVDIDGTKAVTVTIKTAGLTEKAPEYKADVSAVNGKTLESLRREHCERQGSDAVCCRYSLIPGLLPTAMSSSP